MTRQARRDVLSGTALFGVVAVPIFGHETIHAWAESGEYSDVEQATWTIIGLVSACSFLLFVVLFAIRQRIEQDDGFLAIIFYCATRVFSTTAHYESASGESATDSHGQLTDYPVLGADRKLVFCSRRTPFWARTGGRSRRRSKDHLCLYLCQCFLGVI